MADSTVLEYVFAETDVVTGENTAYVLKVKDLPSEEKPREKLM